MQLGKRIMIIGSGGAGKSTLARQLGEALGLPVHHLDTYFWSPGWVETPREVWVPRVEELAKGARWIIDGNYSGTIPNRLAAADTVIFLDYPRLLCLWRVVKRQLQHRGRTRPDLTEGCVERLQWDFIKWIWDYRRRTRARVMKLIEEKGGHAQILIHRSPRETRRMVEGLKDGF